MTHGVFCARPETPAAKVVEKMLALKVRRLFVVDGDGVLIGVISAIDVLGNLRHFGPHDG
ncbi:MAG: CBS domain-containing protein [Gemmataceae bacterium]|nr:CBS domain-containing protein [Gemmataceae bacterium]